MPAPSRGDTSGAPDGRPGGGAPEVTLPPCRLPWVLIRPSWGPTWPRALGDERWRSVSVELIAAGMSNLTYVVTPQGGSADDAVILRRPPTGRGAGHRARHGPRAPGHLRAGRRPPSRCPARCTCAPTSRCSARPSTSWSGSSASTSSATSRPGYADEPEQRRAVGEGLIDVLADLHSVDHEAVGLADFGRPEGFAARQVRRWTKQWDATRDRDRPGLDALAARLAETVPTTQRSGIVHGDYRLDNCLLDPGDARAASRRSWTGRCRRSATR